MAKKEGRTNLVSGAGYHNWEDEPSYRGKFVDDVKNDENEIIGYLFEDSDGEQSVITNTHAITKALNTKVGDGIVRDIDCVLEFTFLGKSVLKSSGREYNRFQIDMLD